MSTAPPDLRGAYRRWLLQAHPDRGGDATAFVEGLDVWRRRLAGYADPPSVVFHRRPRTPRARWTAWRATRRRAPRVR